MTQYEIAPEDLISTCSSFFEKIEFDQWFNISNCNTTQSLLEVAKKENLEIQMEHFLFFAELILRPDTLFRVWYVVPYTLSF